MPARILSYQVQQLRPCRCKRSRVRDSNYIHVLFCGWSTSDMFSGSRSKGRSSAHRHSRESKQAHLLRSSPKSHCFIFCDPDRKSRKSSRYFPHGMYRVCGPRQTVTSGLPIKTWLPKAISPGDHMEFLVRKSHAFLTGCHTRMAMHTILSQLGLRSVCLIDPMTDKVD